MKLSLSPFMPGKFLLKKTMELQAPITVSEILTYLGPLISSQKGDPGQEIRHFCPPEKPRPQGLCFVKDKKSLDGLDTEKIKTLILPSQLEEQELNFSPMPCLLFSPMETFSPIMA